MTYTPGTIYALGKYWTSQGGVNLGVVGNTAHTKGYHLGKDRIFSSTGLGWNDYSVQLARDKAGLTWAASAIDLGKLDGSLANLRKFSKWLVAKCQQDAKFRRDVREIIYSPDGVNVQRWSGVDNKIHSGAGNGDDSHLTHTHISFFRDSEYRDKVPLFEPYFATLPDTSTEVTDVLKITKYGPWTVDIAVGKQLYDLAGKPLIKVSKAQDNVAAPSETIIGSTTYLAVGVTTGGQAQYVLVKASDVTDRRLVGGPKPYPVTVGGKPVGNVVLP